MRRLAQSVVALASVAAGCARPVPRTHTVDIRNFAFAPVETTVAVGDTVVWSNADVVAHTATASDAGWDSKTIDPSAVWRVVARTTGRHEYYCTFHPNMKATLVVR